MRNVEWYYAFAFILKNSLRFPPFHIIHLFQKPSHVSARLLRSNLIYIFNGIIDEKLSRFTHLAAFAVESNVHFNRKLIFGPSPCECNQHWRTTLRNRRRRTEEPSIPFISPQPLWSITHKTIPHTEWVSLTSDQPQWMEIQFNTWAGRGNKFIYGGWKRALYILTQPHTHTRTHSHTQLITHFWSLWATCSMGTCHVVPHNS